MSQRGEPLPPPLPERIREILARSGVTLRPPPPAPHQQPASGSPADRAGTKGLRPKDALGLGPFACPLRLPLPRRRFSLPTACIPVAELLGFLIRFSPRRRPAGKGDPKASIQATATSLSPFPEGRNRTAHDAAAGTLVACRAEQAPSHGLAGAQPPCLRAPRNGPFGHSVSLLYGSPPERPSGTPLVPLSMQRGQAGGLKRNTSCPTRDPTCGAGGQPPVDSAASTAPLKSLIADRMDRPDQMDRTDQMESPSSKHQRATSVDRGR